MKGILICVWSLCWCFFLFGGHPYTGHICNLQDCKDYFQTQLGPSLYRWKSHRVIFISFRKTTTNKSTEKLDFEVLREAGQWRWTLTPAGGHTTKIWNKEVFWETSSGNRARWQSPGDVINRADTQAKSINQSHYQNGTKPPQHSSQKIHPQPKISWCCTGSYLHFLTAFLSRPPLPDSRQSYRF